MGTSRFTKEEIRMIFELEAPKIYRGLRLDRYKTKPDIYRFVATRRLFVLWLTCWDICEYNIPPNVESLSHEELQEEAYRRFGKATQGYELVHFIRKLRGGEDEGTKDT